MASNTTTACPLTVTLSVVSTAVYVIDSAVVSLESKVISPLPFVVVISVPLEACEGSMRAVVDALDVPVTTSVTFTVLSASGSPN